VNIRRCLAALGLVLAASACSNAPEGSRTAYQRGLTAFAQGQPRTARIEFMNAIQAAPNDARLRILQARTYLLLADGPAAEAELSRARELGFPALDTHHLMAHALLLQNRPEQAIEEALRAAPRHGVYAARMRGLAAIALNREAEAADAFNEALAAGSEDSRLWTDIARFRRATGEVAGAIAAADKAASLDPRNVEAITLRGELARGQHGLTASLDWFDRALAIDPKHVPALIERAVTLADLGQAKAMLADTRTILSLSPKHPMAFYLQAMLAARAMKFDLARSLYQRTGGALDEQPAGMLLAGAIEFEAGSPERAIQRLQRLVDLQPYNEKARRLLAAAQWRLGDAAAAISTLRPLADRADADSYVLALIGRAYARQGNRQAAAVYLARAANPQRGTAAALLSEPLDDDQLAALQRSADALPGNAGLQVRLIRALLGRGWSDEALQRARNLQAANPGAPDAHLLAGDALGFRGDYPAAADAYRKAASLSFTEPVAMRLIEALRNSGDSAGATGVLELLLAQNPQSVPAQLLAASALLQAGEWDAAIDIYERLRTRLGNRDATLLNNLAWAYSQKGDHARAIAMARHAWRLDPNNPATADTLGWLLFKSGRDKAQGLSLIEQAARGAPSDRQIRAHLGSATGG
jgi:tetratricopeptide (TPR) repeat protein